MNLINLVVPNTLGTVETARRSSMARNDSGSKNF
jgi:hypothetical protein